MPEIACNWMYAGVATIPFLFLPNRGTASPNTIYEKE